MDISPRPVHARRPRPARALPRDSAVRPGAVPARIRGRHARAHRACAWRGLACACHLVTPCIASGVRAARHARPHRRVHLAPPLHGRLCERLPPRRTEPRSKGRAAPAHRRHGAGAFLRTLVDSTVGSGIVVVAAAPSMSAWLQAVDAAAASIESAGSLSQHASDFPPLDFAMGRIIPMAIDAVRATLGGGAPQVSAAHHPKASALLGAGGRIRGIIISEHHFSPTLRLSLPVPGSHQIPLEHFEQASQRPAGSRPPQAPGGSQSAPRSVLWPRCAASGLCGWILDVSP